MDFTMMDYINETPGILRSILDERDTAFEAFLNYTAKHNIEQIYIIGSGTSCHAGLATKEFLEATLDIKIIPMFPLPFRDQERIFNKNTLVLGISQSGTSMSTIHALDKARALGLPTAALAGMAGSPVLEHADSSVIINCGEEKAVAKTKGYGATLLTLILMGMEMGRRSGKLDKKLYDEYISALETTINNIRPIIDSSCKWYENNSDELNTTNRMLVVGYDNNYGTVLEAALKLLETVRVGVSGYEMEEFMHGIYNSINADSYIFYINSPGEYEQRCVQLKDYMTSSTPHNYMLTGTRRTADPRDLFIPMVNHRYFSVLEYIIPFQCLSYLLSCAKGIDPSKPSDPNFHRNMKSKLV